MVFVISPVYYPHYEGMEVEVEPTEQISLIGEGFFYYLIKEHFKMPLDLKNDIVYCQRAVSEVEKFYEALQTNNSGKVVPSESITQIISSELHQIQDDLSDLFKQLEERTEEFREILIRRGYTMLPNIMNAVLKLEFSHEFREAVTQPMKVKARPTKASLMDLGKEMNTFINLDMMPSNEEEPHISAPARNIATQQIRPENVNPSTITESSQLTVQNSIKAVTTPAEEPLTTTENQLLKTHPVLQTLNCDKRPFEISVVSKVKESDVKEEESTETVLTMAQTVNQVENEQTVTIDEPSQQLSPSKEPLIATEDQLLRVEPHPVEESDTEKESTEKVTAMPQTVNQFDNEQTVIIEEPLQQSSPEKKTKTVKRKATSPQNAPPAKRQRGRPLKAKPQMSEVASKLPVPPTPTPAPAKRGQKSKASKIIKAMPELEPELMDTYDNMNTQVGFLEYFKLCTPEVFIKMKADIYKPKRRRVVRNKHSEYVYGDE